MNGNIECAFVGRVGTDPELRTSQAGKPWLRFSVAVGHDDTVQWVQVAAFGDRAGELASSLKKGDKTYVEGNLKLNLWSDAQGEKRAGLSVAAWKVETLGQIGRKKPTKPKKTTPDNTTPSETSPAAHGANRDWQRHADAEIPF